MELGWDGAWYFGDKATSDAIVELRQAEAAAAVEESCPTSRKRCRCDDAPVADRAPLVVMHTHICALKRSDYFSKALSGPWLENKSAGGSRHGNKRLFVLDIESQVTSRPEAYIKCIELLYYKYICTSDFSGVQMTLMTLDAALHILFQECLDKCMEYLSGMPWTEHETENIRQVFRSRQLVPRDDMVHRLIGKDGQNAAAKTAFQIISTDLIEFMTERPTWASPGWTPRETWQLLLFNDKNDEEEYEAEEEAEEESFMKLGPQAREELYQAWFGATTDLISSDRDHRNAAMEEWMRLFHLLLDSNIADHALNFAVSNKELNKVIFPEALRLDRNHQMSKLVYRIICMIGRGHVISMEGGCYVYESKVVVPGSLLFSLLETWVRWTGFDVFNECVDNLVGWLSLVDQATLFSNGFGFDAMEGPSPSFSNFCNMLRLK